MEYLYEAVEHNRQIPIKIFTQTIDRFPYHWHDDTEILFVLNGELEITIENKTTSLKEGHVFVVNSNELHYIETTSKDQLAKLLVLQFDVDHFTNYGMDRQQLRFEMQYERKGSDKRQAYNQLRGILASMMKVVINKEEPVQLLIERHLMDLMIVLYGQFRAKTDVQEVGEAGKERTVELIKYINKNCGDQSLSLEMIAEHFHLNPQYLSRYFKNQVGVSLKKFIDNMRMNKSLKALAMTEDRIIDIASDFGFPDAKAYYRVFKETMEMTPAEYRQQHKVDNKPEAVPDYFSINSHESLAKLFEYIGQYRYEFSESTNMNQVIHVDVNQNIGRIGDSHKKLMTFGYAPHGLMKEVEKHIKTLQDEIGFEYVRFHAIFSDELRVVNVDDHGRIFYRFDYIDQILDMLISHGLKPFIELGYMPKALASDNQTIFSYNLNVSPPKDMNQWSDFIDVFMRHLINRYGLDTVLTWYFEFWNEPEFKSFYANSLESFYRFFKMTYDTIKNINQDIRLGGFGNFVLETSLAWVDAFGKLAMRDNITLDFTSFHIYQLAVDYSGDILEMAAKVAEHDTSTHFDYQLMAHQTNISLGDETTVINQIKKGAQHLKGLEHAESQVFITEWSANADQSDLVHDTSYMGAYIVKHILACHEDVDAFGYWTASDVFEELLPRPDLFHGGFGLLTRNGIRKPAFHAFSFMNQLGKEIVWQSDIGIVTKSGDDYQILLYNYCHYNDLYAHFDYSQISPTNRYDVFKNQQTKYIALKLHHLHGHYSIERRWVNRDQGSAYDAWIRMGAPKDINQKVVKGLVAASEPGYLYEEVKSASLLSLDIKLEPHEIKLIQLKKIY